MNLLFNLSAFYALWDVLRRKNRYSIKAAEVIAIEGKNVRHTMNLYDSDKASIVNLPSNKGILFHQLYPPRENFGRFFREQEAAPNLAQKHCRFFGSTS